MKITVDKIMIEEMNKKFGSNITYADFKKWYIDVVKVARDNDPKTLKRRKENMESQLILEDILNKGVK